MKSHVITVFLGIFILYVTQVNTYTIRVNSTRNIPSMARKAGGTLYSKSFVEEEIKLSSSSTISPEYTHYSTEEDKSIEFGETSNAEADLDSQTDYEESSEEDECPRGKFWHIRGLRCVPLKCPSGRSARNSETGECLFESSDSKAPYKHVCSYCVENNITPHGRCCHLLMQHPGEDIRRLLLKGGNKYKLSSIRRNMENRAHRGRG